MSERVKWDELTPEQRDRLVAEKVMGWEAKECNGAIGEKPNSPDGWYCLECGYDGGWGSSTKHEGMPPHYSTEMNDTWKLVEKMTSRMGYQDITFEWHGPLFKPEHNYLTQEGYPLGTTCWYVIIVHDGLREFICADTPQESICKAALKAVGVELE